MVTLPVENTVSIFCRRFVRKIYAKKDNSWRKEVMLLTLKVTIGKDIHCRGFKRRF